LPNQTAAAPKRLLPVMVTVVPPPALPVVGVNEVIVGWWAMNSNSWDAVPVPPAVPTLTSTVPATWGSVTARICVGLVTVKLAAAVVPNWTDVAPKKPLPVMVTGVPPLVVPAVGLIDEMTGVGAT